MQLKHLSNSAIDYDKWDKCITEASNSFPYAQSWYLNIVSPGWEAIVSDDYEYIMPLPLKRKYKIPYLVQPVLTQQLGIFSREIISELIIDEFIKAIPYYSYELNLNENNKTSKALECQNLVLDLNQSYQKIATSFTKNTKRNIEKAESLELTLREDIPIHLFLEFYFHNFKNTLSSQQKSIFSEVVENGVLNNVAELYGVLSGSNSLIAVLCLLKSDSRLVYLLPVSNTEGKNSSAMFLLVNNIIKKEALTNKILDFEGSTLEGIARFYKGFGSKNQPYYILKRFRPSIITMK